MGWNRRLNKGYGSRVRKMSLQITTAELTAAATSEALDIGVLPAGAVVLGREIVQTTPFSGGGATAASVDVGYATDPDIIEDGADVFATIARQAGTSGVSPNAALGGETLQATVISDVNVSTLTAGDITVYVWFAVADV
jgi:hypothetical protein